MEGFAVLIVFLMVCAAIVGAWRALSDPKRAPEGYHCMSCGSNTSEPRRTSPLGFFAVILWLVAIVAAFTVSWLCILIGFLGHIMADRARRVVCPTCNHEHLVPAHTPAAKAHAATLERPSGR